MIDVDLDIRIEKKLLLILKNRRKKFLKYLENNNINYTDSKEIEKATKKFVEEDKKVLGISKVLLIYTLLEFTKNIKEEKRKKFTEKVKKELFDNTLKKADIRIEELYIDTTKRTAYYLDKYIQKLREDKAKASMTEFEKITKRDILKYEWEQAKENVYKKMETSDILHSVNVLGETQAEYTKIIMEKLGIDTFLWKTKQDDRVRDKHRWREGKIFTKDGKLVNGIPVDDDIILPKQEWGCRCSMQINEKRVEEALNDIM